MSVSPREVIAQSLPGMVDFGRPYGRPLPEELAPWHCYTLDGGHCILVVLDDGRLGDQPSREEIEGRLVPAPVKAVEREGWRMVDGFVVCKLPYDPVLGLVVPEEDDEYGDGTEESAPPAPEQHTLAVGEPYPSRVAWTDGQAQTAITAGGVTFVLPLRQPSDSEVHAFRKGNAEFALYPGDHFALLLYRFSNPKGSRNPAASGPGIEWSDAGWEYHRQAMGAAQPAPPGVPGGSFPLELVLVDADTNVVKALRLIGPTTEFADAVRAAVTRQAQQAPAFEHAMAEIDSLYARYPRSADLLPLCEARFEALRDGTAR
ncbi:hypothetical protein AB0G49_14160 [Streptomyces longwoodensis]|uniref:hypothetical protein n=1 Tax=Streptomyces longwoodensis TaxID=68231 RepID=UPI0033FE23DC